MFRNSLNSGIFPQNWKRSNIAPVYKKKTSNLQNICPVSLMPVSSKIFELISFVNYIYIYILYIYIYIYIYIYDCIYIYDYIYDF